MSYPDYSPSLKVEENINYWQTQDNFFWFINVVTKKTDDFFLSECMIVLPWKG